MNGVMSSINKFLKYFVPLVTILILIITNLVAQPKEALIPETLKNKITQKVKGVFKTEPINLKFFQAAPSNFKNYFPDTDVYEIEYGLYRPFTLIVAVKDTNVYGMPTDFNYLLKSENINIVKNNLIEIAKSFIQLNSPKLYRNIEFIYIQLIDEVFNDIHYNLKIITYIKTNGILKE